jgi:hypothetical protein
MDDAQLRARMMAAADLAGREARVPGAPAARRRGRRRQLTLAVTLAATATAVVLAVPVGGRLLDGGPGVAPAGGSAGPTPAPTPTESPVEDLSEDPPAPAGAVHTLASGTTGDGRTWRFEGYKSVDGRACVYFRAARPEDELPDCDTPNGTLGSTPHAPGDMIVRGGGPIYDVHGKPTGMQEVYGPVVPTAAKVRLVLKGGRRIDATVIDGAVLGLRVHLFAAAFSGEPEYSYAIAFDAEGRTVACQGIYERIELDQACKPYLDRVNAGTP